MVTFRGVEHMALQLQLNHLMLHECGCKQDFYLSSTDDSLAPHLFLLDQNNVASADCTGTANIEGPWVRVWSSPVSIE